jgi:cell division protein FtsB
VSLARWWPIPVIVCAALVVAALDGRAGLRAFWELRAALREAQSERADLEREVAGLRAQADALEGDKFAIESAIRERLRLARRGETLVRLSEPEPASPRFP